MLLLTELLLEPQRPLIEGPIGGGLTAIGGALTAILHRGNSICRALGACSVSCLLKSGTFTVNWRISLGRYRSCQHRAFSGVGSIVASFVSTECPKGRGMWGMFGKPLKRAIWNTPGLHAVLTTCLRFLSVSDDVCAACCPLLLTGTHHVCLQIHVPCCCLPRCTTETFGAEKSSLWGCHRFQKVYTYPPLQNEILVLWTKKLRKP